MLRTLIVTMLFVIALPAFAKMYKCTDADGNIIYTDEPCIGGEELKLPPLPTFKAPPVKPDTTRSSGENKAFEYTKLEISKPANDEMLEDQSGKVEILVDIVPALQHLDGHRLTVSLDGTKLKGAGTTTRIQLDKVERGSHTLQVSIINEAGTVLKTSPPVTFHNRRPSLNRPRPLNVPGVPGAPGAPRSLGR